MITLLIGSHVACVSKVRCIAHCRFPAAQSLLETTPERIARVVQTNLLGSLLCTRAAARAMAATGGGHIFNMDGAGADGQATPQYAAYGATKAGACFLAFLKR